MSAFKLPPLSEADPEAYATAAGWPEIRQPEPATPDLPTFPAWLLPPAIGRMVEQTAAEIQAPVDIAGMLALPVAAANLAGKIVFVGRAGHREHPMIWTLCAALTSERKTPVFNKLRSPLDQAAIEYAEPYQIESEFRQTELDLVELNLKKLKDQLTVDARDHGSTRITPAVRAEMEALLKQRRQLEQPLYRPCVWATSPTPEGLHTVMAANGGRVAIFSDEGGLVGTLAGRYSSKDGADMDPFLSGFVGSPLKTPRATSGRKDVDAAYVTIGLAVQPSVLDELGAMKGAADRGLLGRFLFAVSSTLVGTRMYGDSVAVEEEVAEEYRRKLAEWANWPGDVDPTTGRTNLLEIGLTDAAYRAYEKFYDSIELRQRDGGDLHEATIASKIAGTTLRLAGLFHCYDLGLIAARRTLIDEDPMNRAIELTENFFIPHALAVSARFVTASVTGLEERIIAKIQRDEMREFKFRDLYQGLKRKGGTVQKASDLDEPIAALLEDGYLREVEKEGTGGHGRSRWYEANPRLFAPRSPNVPQ